MNLKIINCYAILGATSNSPARCAGFQRERNLCASLFLLSSIELYFFMQRNHIDVLIFPINTAVCLDTTTSILKCLCDSRVIGQVQVIYYVIFVVKKIIEVGVAAWIYTLPVRSHFVLESSALFWQIKYETKPSFWRGFNGPYPKLYEAIQALYTTCFTNAILSLYFCVASVIFWLGV